MFSPYIFDSFFYTNFNAQQRLLSDRFASQKWYRYLFDLRNRAKEFHLGLSEVFNFLITLVANLLIFHKILHITSD